MHGKFVRIYLYSLVDWRALKSLNYQQYNIIVYYYRIIHIIIYIYYMQSILRKAVQELNYLPTSQK